MQNKLDVLLSRSDDDIRKIMYQSKYNIDMAGMGEKKKVCGSQILTFVSSDGQAVKFQSVSCGRFECPVCYKTWERETAKDSAIKLICFARDNDMHIGASLGSPPVKSLTSKGYGYKDLNQHMFRRTYNRIKKSGGVGGVAISHDVRLNEKSKKELIDLGYNKNGSGGLWRGVRENALNHDDWRKYTKFSPHVHTLFLFDDEVYYKQDRKRKDFVFKVKTDDNKKAVRLDTNKVISYVRYLLSHSTKNKDIRSKSIRWFGKLKGYDETKSIHYETVKKEVLEAMLLKVVDETITNKDCDNDNNEINWLPVYSLWALMGSSDWKQHLTIAQYDFYRVILMLMENKNKLLYDTFGSFPNDIQVFYEQYDNDDDGDIVNVDGD